MDFSGSAYVFDRDAEGTWHPVQKLEAADGAGSDFFGSALMLSGEVVVAGADGDDDLGIGSGSAYVYDGRVGAVAGLQP